MFAECMKSVGMKSVSLAMKPTLLEGKSEIVTSLPQLRGAIDAADIVVLMHSHPALLKLPINFNGKRLVAFHGGSIYRMSHEAINGLFNPMVEACLVQTGELLDHGAKNEHWILPAIDTEIEPKYSHLEGNIIIGHYPRDQYGTGLKGTPEIGRTVLRAIENGYPIEYRHETRLVSWEENIDRMRECDIYIESLSQGSTHPNKHDWSITALEAAVAGCIVVTNFTHMKRYEGEYGRCLLQVANTESQLYEVLTNLVNMSKKDLHRLQRETRNWACELHSYRAIGRRLQRVLNV